MFGSQHLPRRSLQRCYSTVVQTAQYTNKRQRFGCAHHLSRPCQQAPDTILVRSALVGRDVRFQSSDGGGDSSGGGDGGGVGGGGPAVAYASAPLAATKPKHRLSLEQIQKVDRIFHKFLWLDLIEVSMFLEEYNRRMGVKLSEKERQNLAKICDQEINEREGGSDGDGSSGGKDAAPEEAAPAEVKLVALKLTGFDAKSKIKIIKEVRSISGLGLKEAKELVESVPATIQKDLKPEQAAELKAKLEAAGGIVALD
ncbi:hypothetical protein ACA910_020739 [Epithemia clementina (nom. ined.)]